MNLPRAFGFKSLKYSNWCLDLFSAVECACHVSVGDAATLFQKCIWLNSAKEFAGRPAISRAILG